MAPSTSMPELLDDLEEEQSELDTVLARLGFEQWDTATPAEGWAVRDQVSHLAYFDDAATAAASDPDAFAAMARHALSAATTGADPMDEHLRRGRAMTGPEVLDWWRSARQRFRSAAAGLPAGRRVPWYGPPMGPLSLVSARLMETWAHGQDVADALGTTRVPTRRLAHVAHVGVLARPFSYAVHGMAPPPGSVRVELEGPAGERWVWGEDAGPGRVTGPALDFCLVVTRRRHLADTGLVVDGPDAREWMSVAQAYAGPPGPGRQPKGGG